ncbi:hypothetical protein H0E87_004132 [Populus deltoides]|uniref:Uncharacterized protein n=1 Tax=Populus deltoides TaxID=3696 RepID=A0A8T2ZDV6_POPDE|nr:hypothetical protein H0E87_004132 [Populus deltoides]
MGKGREKQVGVPVIIAMKGHPGTGKSTLASSLASSLKIPLIDKDDVRDCTIASTQLRLGLSVIIDSPLSRRAHLDRLVQVASSTGSLLVIVECKPLDEGVWRRRLEQRGKGDQASWHKPSTWQDLERLLEGYGGSTDYDIGDVPKIVLDTSVAVSVDELVSRVVDFVVSSACTGYHN